MRPFVDFLVELRRGRVAVELTEALHELIAQVKDTGKPGSLSLVIKVSKQKKTEGMLVIDDNVITKMPPRDRDSSLWFVDHDGNPTRQDPNQLEFQGIRVITTDTTPTTGEAKQA
ncbi:hypothetical protein IU433_12365 [Nocardia puris]|nr:hypothetical protein [Nocardia puris]